MKNRIRSLSFLATPALVLGLISWGGTLHAQTTPSTPQDQQPQSQQPAQDTPARQDPQTQPAPAPDPSAQQPAPSEQTSQPDQTQGAKTPSSDSQTFSGTVEKSGDKYVLKDDAGHTYDIDHQDEVKKFEGKRVRVQGTLDPTGKKILVK